MKYYKYLDEESPIGGGVRYIETDDEDVSYREVTWNGARCLASNINYPHWGMCLSDQPAPYDEIDEVTPISKSEFDAAWNKNLAQTAVRWLFTKLAYPSGTPVQGFIILFYPQGVIVNLGNSVLGVADYKACRHSTKPEFMYPGHKVTATVKDYDELNQWLILDAPKVHAQQISESI